MDNPFLSPSIPRIIPPRTHSRTPSRSPTRRSFTDDILSDLSPASTLELFTSPSGKLKASIEAATPNERAFGIRATLASKKIQEWVDELSAWPWPKEGGFELPAAKRRKLSPDVEPRNTSNGNGHSEVKDEEPEYCGSILTTEVLRYEERIDDITADMEDLDVEEIKRQVLDTHFSPKSRPSSSASSAPIPSFLSSYTRMDDFTAIVTYTVLQSLPNLSRLLRLMDVWSIRLNVLLKVPPLTLALDDVEVALKSGWAAIKQNTSHTGEDEVLTRRSFEVMRNVLQDKVTSLGQDLDFMLDTLEGRQDTLPEEWLDRMESIELDYGNWVVAGDRKVREGEWARMARKRKEEEDARIAEEARLAEAARRKAEEDARLREIRIAEEAAAAELLRRKAEEERLAHEKLLKEAEDARKAKEAEEQAAQEKAQKDAEDARVAKEAELAEIAKLKAAEEARLQATKVAQAAAEAAEVKRKQEEEAANKAREAELAEIARLKVAEEARLQALKAAQAAAAAESKRKQDEEVAKQKAAEEVRLAKLAKQKEEAAIKAKEAELAEVARRQAEEARLKAVQQAEEAVAAELLRRKAEEEAARQKALKEAEDSRRLAEAELARQKAEESRLKAIKEAEELAAAESLWKHAEEEAARERARKEAEEESRLKTVREAEELAAAGLLQRKAEEEAARESALKEAEEESRLRAAKEAEEIAAAKLLRREAEEEAAAQIRALKEAEVTRIAELAKRKADEAAAQAKAADLARKQAAQEATRLRALKAAEDARIAELVKQEADEAVAKAKADEFAQKQAQEEAETESRRKALEELERAQAIETARLQAQAAVAESQRLQAIQDAKDLEAVELLKHKTREEEAAREKAFVEAESGRKAAALESLRQKERKDEERLELTTKQPQNDEVAKSRILQPDKPHHPTTKVSTVTHSPPLDASTPTSHSEPNEIFKSALIDETTTSRMGTALNAVVAGAGIVAVSNLAKSSFSAPRRSKFTEHLDSDISELPILMDYDARMPKSIATTPAVQPNQMEAAQEPPFDVTKATNKPESEGGLTALSNDNAEPQTPSASKPASSSSDISAESDTKDASSSPRYSPPQVGHPFANMLRQMTPPSAAIDQSVASLDEAHHSPANIDRECNNQHEVISPPSPRRRPQPICTFSHDGAEERELSEPDVFGVSEGEPLEAGYESDEGQNSLLDLERIRSIEAARPLYPERSAVNEDRRLSALSNYLEGDLTDSLETEPAEYLRPALSPTKSPVSFPSDSAPTTPTQSSFPVNEIGEKDPPETIIPFRSPPQLRLSTDSTLPPVAEEHSPRAKELSGADGSIDDCEACEEYIEDHETNVTIVSRKASTTSLNSGMEFESFDRRESMASSTSTVITNRLSDAPSSPTVDSRSGSFQEEYEQSPTAGRAGLRGKSLDFSPPGSPTMPALPHLKTAQLRHSPSLDFLDPSSPLTPLEAPILESVEISNTPIMSSPKKVNTDDKIQNQISSILESIPARIQLNSSLNEPKSFTSESLRIQKTRRSITPSYRSSSSMSNYSNSSRATTPSFTLAPAYGRTSTRARPPTTNPDIKLYHLTRSTGEKAIKLHVRLVGEHGERVMVRVGGGWADLGEYLKAYASHHSRRGATGTSDKIEIQDLPTKTPRVASNASTISTATIRGNGRDSPLQRPQTSLSRGRPSSSLDVRKTRKSFGEKSERAPFTSRLSDYRSPSTPVPAINHAAYDTPSSVATSSDTPSSMRSSSRMSWNEEDASLGLAGPKGKKVQISERDQEWVDNMTEKVKLASAEKEKEKERKIKEFKARDRKTSLGEMDKVGGTKRLFRKS